MGFLSAKNEGDMYIDTVLTQTGLYNLFVKRTKQALTDSDPFKAVYFSLHDDEINYNLYNNSSTNQGFDTSNVTVDNNFDLIKDMVLLEPTQNTNSLDSINSKLFGFREIIPNTNISSNSLDSSATQAFDNNSTTPNQDSSIRNIIVEYSNPISIDEVNSSKSSMQGNKFVGGWVSPSSTEYSVNQSVHSPDTTIAGIEYSSQYQDINGNILTDDTLKAMLHIKCVDLNLEASIDITKSTKYDLTLHTFLLALKYGEDKISTVISHFICKYEINIEIISIFGNTLFEKKFITLNRTEPLPEGFTKLTRNNVDGSVDSRIINTNSNPISIDALNNIKNVLSTNIPLAHTGKKLIAFNASKTLYASTNYPISNFTQDQKLKDYINDYYQNNIYALMSPFTFEFSIPPTNQINLKLIAWNSKEQIQLIRMETETNNNVEDGLEFALPINNYILGLKFYIIYYVDKINYYLDNSVLSIFDNSPYKFNKVSEEFQSDANSHIVYESQLNNAYRIHIYYPSYQNLSNRQSNITSSYLKQEIDISTMAFLIHDDYNYVIIRDSGQRSIGTYDPIIFIGKDK